MSGISAIGPVMQMAFCPDDFEAALDYWTNAMGVGPFFLMENVALEGMTYRGAPSDFTFTMALAYWGDVQVELIKPTSDAPSIYTGRKGNAMHHVCILTDDFAAARETMIANGAEIIVEAKVGQDGAVLYADTGKGDGIMVEVLRPATGSDAFFGMMREAARNWDGSEPLRKVG